MRSRSSHDPQVTRPPSKSVGSALVVADRAAIDLARSQHAAITISQLLAVGHTRASVRHRVASGWLRRKHIGAYLLGPAEPPLAPAMAAVLAPRRRRAAQPLPSRRSVRPAPADRATDARDGGRTPGPRTQGRARPCVGHLHPSDITRRHVVPVTSPARTLLTSPPRSPARPRPRGQRGPRPPTRLRGFPRCAVRSLPPPPRDRRTEASNSVRTQAHPFRGRAPPARAHPRRAPPRAREQREAPRPRGRHALARPTSRRITWRQIPATQPRSWPFSPAPQLAR